MARKSLEEQLAQNQLELEQMRKAFAEKEKILKQKIDAQKKQQAAAYKCGGVPPCGREPAAVSGCADR